MQGGENNPSASLKSSVGVARRRRVIVLSFQSSVPQLDHEYHEITNGTIKKLKKYAFFLLFKSFLIQSLFQLPASHAITFGDAVAMILLIKHNRFITALQQ